MYLRTRSHGWGQHYKVTMQVHRHKLGSILIWPEIIACLLLFYILATSKVISGQVLTCDSARAWWLYSASPLGNHNLIFHSVTLSWHWDNQSLPYPNNAERMAKKWQLSILRSFEPMKSEYGMVYWGFTSYKRQMYAILSLSTSYPPTFDPTYLAKIIILSQFVDHSWALWLK